MSEDQHPRRKLAIGTLIAGAVGYIAGILTAPKSGKELRQDIADKPGEIKADTEAQLQKAHDELDELVKAGKNKGSDLSARAKAELNDAIIKAKDARTKAATVLKAVRAGQTDDPQLNKAIKQAKQAKNNLTKYFKS